MNLKELISKIDKLNKMNNELDFDDKYYLVVCGRYDKPVYIYNKKDIRKIKEYYIDSISNMLINKELKKEEKYLYVIDEYEVRIGIK
jgi:hypothetical protein